ncbi:MAG: cysteine methyltransferase [Alkaliphilus sp.]|nr:MAG: cysteine methyltransferase [Alkaliphilus sp.]
MIICKNESNNRKNSIVTIETPSPIGTIFAGGTDEGIYFIEFIDEENKDNQVKKLEKIFRKRLVPGFCIHFETLTKQLSEYFDGSRSQFNIPLVINGTDFQKKAWKALLAIPYGETIFYQEQAIALKNTKAVRAVANANRNNRISIIIPCHRVIGKDGSMTGYAGGIWRKKLLLKLENENK